jgi:uncharacterized membrane protein YtjA (UPF0391 family)
MLRLALLFLLIALLAGLLHLSGVEAISLGAAELFFLLFLAFSVVLVVVGLLRDADKRL